MSLPRSWKKFIGRQAGIATQIYRVLILHLNKIIIITVTRIHLGRKHYCTEFCTNQTKSSFSLPLLRLINTSTLYFTEGSHQEYKTSKKDNKNAVYGKIYTTVFSTFFFALIFLWSVEIGRTQKLVVFNCQVHLFIRAITLMEFSAQCYICPTETDFPMGLDGRNDCGMRRKKWVWKAWLKAFVTSWLQWCPPWSIGVTVHCERTCLWQLLLLP